MSAATQTTIEQRFNTAFTISRPTVTVQYGNVEFDPPANESPWVRFTILDGRSRAAAVGDALKRGVGVIMVNIFTKRGIGEGLAREIADDVMTIFDRQQDGSIIYRPSNGEPGQPDDAWFQYNVRIPFEVTE